MPKCSFIPDITAAVLFGVAAFIIFADTPAYSPAIAELVDSSIKFYYK